MDHEDERKKLQSIGFNASGDNYTDHVMPGSSNSHLLKKIS